MKTIFTERNATAPLPEAGNRPPVASVSKTGELEKQISDTKVRMGVFQAGLFKLETGAIARHNLTEMLEVVMEKAKEDLRHRCLLAHDLQKKANHADYLTAAGDLDMRVTEASNALDRKLAALLPSEIEKLLTMRVDWMKRLEASNAPDAIREKELARMEEWISKMIDSVEAKVELIIANQAKALQQTLTLLGERPPAA